MSNIPITSLPVVVSLDGSEAVPLVQAGTTKRATIAQINAANAANIPSGGLTGQALVKATNANYDTAWATVAGLGTVQSVATGAGLTGGPITLTGTIALAAIADGRVLANVSGGSLAPSATTPSAVLDVIGSTRGQVLYRGAGGWAALAPGTLGQILTTGGAGADPAWSGVGSGSVQSVALALPAIFTISGSPVTTTGTLTGTLATQTANLVWSGPATGAAAQPTFRSLVGADLPNPSAIALGGVQSIAAVASNWIRSISTSGVPALSQPAFSDLSGNIALSQFGTQTANRVLSGPASGGAADPTFRALVGADLPNPSSTTLGGVRSIVATTSQWVNTISTSGIPSSTQPGFSDISGSATLAQLPSIGNNTILANTSGGSNVPAATSLTTLLDTLGATQGQVLYRNASAWVPLAVGTSGQVLTTNGAAANPSWATVTGTGTVTSVAAGTGLTGGPITGAGTLLFADIAASRILANITGGAAPPIPNTMTSLLDIIGSTQGQVLYRGASNWTALSAGTSGQFLQTLGAGSTPQWAAAVSFAGTVPADNAITRFDGITGNVIQRTQVTIDDSQNMAGLNSIAGNVIATQANQETATSVINVVTPGTQQYHPSAPKAWCRVTQSGGTYTLGAAYNVSGIGKNGTGDVTVSFTVAMSGVNNYAPLASSNEAGSYSINVTNLLAGSVQVTIRNSTTGAAADGGFTVAVFGDL